MVFRRHLRKAASNINPQSKWRFSGYFMLFHAISQCRIDTHQDEGQGKDLRSQLRQAQGDAVASQELHLLRIQRCLNNLIYKMILKNLKDIQNNI